MIPLASACALGVRGIVRGGDEGRVWRWGWSEGKWMQSANLKDMYWTANLTDTCKGLHTESGCVCMSVCARVCVIRTHCLLVNVYLLLSCQHLVPDSASNAVARHD